MEEKIQKQIEFFDRIKDLIPPNNSMVQILADLLEISTDSMYRRIRGETSLSFDEVGILCNHYKISFDSFINLNSGNVTFNYTLMEDGETSFKKYLSSMRDDLIKIKAANNPLITYACEDVAIFHSLNDSGLALFKMMYWMKAIMNIDNYENTKFNFDAINPELSRIGKEIYELYCSIPSIEIWTDTTIRGTLKQIEFFWESGMFESANDAIQVINSLKNTIQRIQKQAETGCKILNQTEMKEEEKDNFSFYLSDMELTNNCVLVNLDTIKSVYLGHLTFTTMSTSNATYCQQTEKWLENIKRKSTLISTVAEKTRYQFFQSIYNNIDQLLHAIET